MVDRALNAARPAPIGDGQRAETLLFLHIPKTAGLTMRQILARNYAPSATFRNRPAKKKENKGGERLAKVIRGEAPARPTKPDRNRALKRQIAALSDEKRAEVRLVMGHFWFGLHEAFEQPCTYITILRDPIERVLSLYNHRLTQHNLAMQVDDYVRSGRDFAMDNEQVRRLVGPLPDEDIRRIPCSDELLETAKSNLRSRMAVAGLTERFDESLVLMARHFGWKHISYVRENVASKRVKRAELDPGVFQLIEDHNRYDVELYRYATELFDERVRATPGIEAEVERLRTKNAREARVQSTVPLAGALRRFKTGERPTVRGALAKLSSFVRPESEPEDGPRRKGNKRATAGNRGKGNNRAKGNSPAKGKRRPK